MDVQTIIIALQIFNLAGVGKIIAYFIGIEKRIATMEGFCKARNASASSREQGGCV